MTVTQLLCWGAQVCLLWMLVVLFFHWLAAFWVFFLFIYNYLCYKYTLIAQYTGKKINITDNVHLKQNAQYLLLTELEVCTVSINGSSFFCLDGPSMKHGGEKSKGKKQGSLTYSTDQENEVSKIFIIFLGSKRCGRFQSSGMAIDDWCTSNPKCWGNLLFFFFSKSNWSDLSH